MTRDELVEENARLKARVAELEGARDAFRTAWKLAVRAALMATNTSLDRLEQAVREVKAS
jgi:hypothetical protein